MPRLSENAISFFGAGGHKHDGVSSTLISTDKYSLFDFNPGYRGSQSRITIQQANQSALEEWVMNLVNTKVLAPAGLDLAPGLLSGKSIRANTITATELQANTITADEIAANAVTANELAANLVLVNNVIRSNNYNGTIAANGEITANGNAGWAITSFGSAEFANAVIRGNVTANAGSIGGWNVDSNSLYSGTKSSNGNYATSGITIGSSGFISAKEFRLDADGNAYFKGDLNGANIVGVTGRFTGSVTVNGDLTAGGTTIYSNGQITNGGYTLSSTGVLTATGANITGTINADYGYVGDWTISGALSSTADNVSSWQTIVLDATDGIYTRRWQYGYVGSGYYTDVKINYGSFGSGIDVVGTASGYTKTTEIRSSYIKSDQLFIGSDDVQTLLNGKSGTSHTHSYAAISHTHSYAATSHTHSYVSTSGDTIDGILNVNDQVFISAALGTNTTPALRVNRSYDSTGGYFVEFTNTAGSVRAGYIRYVIGANNQVFYATTSDGRLKELVDVEHSMLDKINKLNPTYYKWKNSDPNILFYGFIAQELHPIFPEVASEGDHDEPYVMENGNINVTDAWGVDYSKLVPPLVKAIQELSAKVDSLESRIQTLEGV